MSKAQGLCEDEAGAAFTSSEPSFASALVVTHQDSHHTVQSVDDSTYDVLHQELAETAQPADDSTSIGMHPKLDDTTQMILETLKESEEPRHNEPGDDPLDSPLPLYEHGGSTIPSDFHW